MKKYEAIIYDIDGTLLNTLNMNMYPLMKIIKEEITVGKYKVAAAMLKKPFSHIKQRFDADEVGGAPFLGLLGTVWGVMDCFGSMSAQTSVTLQQLAPGVAGALLTTVAGLLVAIPAVFGYNYLTSRARTMSAELENFASLLADKIELESREASIAESREKPAERKPVMASKVEENPRQTKVINFSLEDDDEDTPTPLRDFD